MFFLVYGGDSFRSRKKLAALREHFSTSRASSGLNCQTLRAADVDADAVAEAVFASPFLAEKKMVILEGFLQAAADVQERVKDLLTRKPASTIVIFFEDAGAEDLAKSPLLPLLEAQQYTSECAPLSPAQAAAFALEEAKSQGVTLTRRAADELVTRAGADSWQINLELQKVTAYAAAKGLAQADEKVVAQLVGGHDEESVFAFVDACLEGRTGEAAKMLGGLLASGTAELQIVALLQRQFRLIIAARDLLDHGLRDKNALAAKLGVSPYPAGKAMAAARKFSREELNGRFADLVEIERKCKTSAGRPEVLLDIFAAKMTKTAA